MSLANVTIDWDARPYIAQVKAAMEEVAKDGAEYIEEQAKRNLERAAPDSTGTLASQIAVKASQFADGGWLVEAQGSGNYDVITTKTGKIRRRFYASFVELGSINNVPLRYLRRAMARGKYRMRAKMRQKLEAEIRE